jgi:hypothetical protein
MNWKIKGENIDITPNSRSELVIDNQTGRHMELNATEKSLLPV